MGKVAAFYYVKYIHKRLKRDAFVRLYQDGGAPVKTIESFKQFLSAYGSCVVVDNAVSVDFYSLETQQLLPVLGSLRQLDRD
jgi:hypothetical protein